MNRLLCKEEAKEDPFVDNGLKNTLENGNLMEQLAFSMENETFATKPGTQDLLGHSGHQRPIRVTEDQSELGGMLAAHICGMEARQRTDPEGERNARIL